MRDAMALWRRLWRSHVVDETALEDTVFALAASPDFAEDRTIYAARATGLYRSTDGGASWQPAYSSLSLQRDLVTSAVAVSPDFGRAHTVFAGCSGGVVCSYDAGQTWHVITLPTPPSIVSCLAFSPSYADDGIAFLGTMEDGVYRSADRGQSWARWNFGLFDLRVLALAVPPDFFHDETVFTGTETGIYVSKSGGRSWRPLPFPEEVAPVLSLAVSPNFAHDGNLWAGTDSAGLWVSADRGKIWRRSGEEALQASVNALIVSGQSPTEQKILVLATEGLLLSRDGGGTWTSLAAELLADLEPAAVASPEGVAGALLVGLADGRVLRLADVTME
jgi:photosystem II stability/assembly factor-like uncharacterized protein